MYIKLTVHEQPAPIWFHADTILQIEPTTDGTTIHTGLGRTYIVDETPATLLALLQTDAEATPPRFRAHDDDLGVAVAGDLKRIHERLIAIEQTVVTVLGRVDSPPSVPMRFYLDDPKAPA